jgi:hypothetical protein
MREETLEKFLGKRVRIVWECDDGHKKFKKKKTGIFRRTDDWNYTVVKCQTCGWTVIEVVPTNRCGVCNKPTLERTEESMSFYSIQVPAVFDKNPSTGKVELKQKRMKYPVAGEHIISIKQVKG